MGCTSHEERIREVLHELPELPQALIDLGYATDTSWIEERARVVESSAA